MVKLVCEGINLTGCPSRSTFLEETRSKNTARHYAALEGWRVYLDDAKLHHDVCGTCRSGAWDAAGTRT